MKIKQMTSRSRRDFICIYECDHCGAIREGRGYDDSYFHNTVIPSMACRTCGKTAGDDYKPSSPKYDDSVVV